MGKVLVQEKWFEVQGEAPKLSSPKLSSGWAMN